MSSFLVLSEGDTRNRWRDGQVCPDVGQGTMAPWARRLWCVLACYAQIGRGRSRETFERKKTGEREEREKRREEDEKGERESRRLKKRRKGVEKRERETSPPCMEKSAESEDWSEKDDERQWR
ncbi:hypothetical protein TNCV_3144731 [Trichonephila clavipes]|nr:hypothetical protein TNCV_3144731 [Trichonephila clavipes]